MSPFPSLPAGYPFPVLEAEVLAFWRERGIFARSLEASAGRPRFVFFEGPPTANNVPHVGHVVSRVVKDLFPRFRTMRGFHVPRKAGWDTHGLPVEIEVEKRLGFTGKKDIEAYGIERFNRECLDSVHTYERQWRAMTERIGFWLDLDDAYYTYRNRYVESVWWALAELFRKGLLTTDYKIQPYCARCGTTLSSHEVAQNYKDADDPSVWVLFPARPGQRLATLAGGEWTVPDGLHLVAWTTTPWTLTGHVGLAVHPGLTYKVVAHPGRPGVRLLFAEGLEAPVPLDAERDGSHRRLDLRELPALARFRGSALAGLRYDRPYRVERPEIEYPPRTVAALDTAGWPVFPADYVTAAEGTGLVHTAPMFGEDDFAAGQRERLPRLLTVDGEGRIADKPGIQKFAGLPFKAADPEILRDLRERSLLLHAERCRHSYPFCWRCDQPLLYYASLSWFVRTTRRKDALVAKNREIGWHPAHIGEGRFGNWLESLVDWALSRRRYWGTPLPIWACSRCGHQEAVGSYAELFRKAGRPLPADPYEANQFNPHRPFIDTFTWPCPQGCGELARVEEVIDAWFDSGAMPFAQHHYPFENRELVEGGIAFPADFIAEAVDQTRGWFYTLHVLGVLLFDSVAYRHCLVQGHVNDEQGRKMSKRLGNVVDPLSVIEETGADALRWYFYATNPEQTSRFSARLVRESAQRLLIPLWNALSFFTIYANLDGFGAPPPGEGAREPAFAARPSLDRWILLRLGRLVADTTAHLEAYRVTEAARGIEAFLDELTNWYIRRSRGRFWAGGEAAAPAPAAADKESAYRTLHEVLATLSRLLAPFTPFVAEVLHRHLVASQDPAAVESVHLAPWPEPAEGRTDERLEAGMAAVQRIVRLGHAARKGHGLKTRQPLPAVTLVSADPELPQLIAPHLDLLREELNVRAVGWAAARGVYVRHEVTPVWSRCGPRFGARMRAVQQALGAADGDALAAALERDGAVTLDVESEAVSLAAEELHVRLIEREGTATQGDRELLVALDTTLDPELLAEGWAREVVHRIQAARKAAELDYAERIRVHYRAAPQLAAAIAAHRGWIAGETLAVEIAATDGAGASLETAPVEGMDFAIAIERVD